MTGEEIRKIVSLRHDQTAGETELRDEVEILDGTNAAEVSSDIYHEHYNIETRIRLKGGKEVYRRQTDLSPLAAFTDTGKKFA